MSGMIQAILGRLGGEGGALKVGVSVLGGVSRNLGDRAADDVSVRDFGAVGDGVADDAGAVRAALDASKSVKFGRGTFRIASTVSIPAGRSLDLRGADVVADTGAGPLFLFDGAKEQLSIVGGGGIVSGTASEFLKCVGATDTPTNAGQYARQIRIEGVHVTSVSIGALLGMNSAVRQVFIDKVMAYTQSGIVGVGKIVEVHISKSIIYGAVGGVGSAGIKLRSTGGAGAYSEGLHIDTCTIDNFENSFDIRDIYGFTLVNSYVGSSAGGKAVVISPPAVGLSESINIGSGCIFASGVVFESGASGWAANAILNGALFTGVDGIAVQIKLNASQISVLNCKFKAGAGGAVGVVGYGNNNSLIADRLDFDSTYVNGVVFNGASGVGCEIGRLSGETSGDIVGAGRSNIKYAGIPVSSNVVAGMLKSISGANLGGGAVVAVGGVVGSVAVGLSKGESGLIEVRIPFSGANASTQNVQIETPAGMVLDSGAGFSAANLYLGAASGLLSAMVPYRCTSDVTGSVRLLNQAGNALTVNNQAFISVRRGGA